MESHSRVVDVSKPGGRHSAPEIRSIFSRFAEIRAVYPWKSFDDDVEHAFVEFRYTFPEDRCARMALETGFCVASLQSQQALRARFDALLGATQGRPVPSFHGPRQPKPPAHRHLDRYAYSKLEANTRTRPLKSEQLDQRAQPALKLHSHPTERRGSGGHIQATSSARTSSPQSRSSASSASTAHTSITETLHSPSTASAIPSPAVLPLPPNHVSLTLRDTTGGTLLNLGNGFALPLASLLADSKPVIDILNHNNATIGAFLVVAREYKVRNMLDQAHDVATGAVQMLLDRGDSNGAKPVYIFISSLHTARAKQCSPGGADDKSAQTHMREAATYINMAHAPSIPAKTSSSTSISNTTALAVARVPRPAVASVLQDTATASHETLRPLPSNELDNGAARPACATSTARGTPTTISDIISSIASGDARADQSAELDGLRVAKRKLEHDLDNERAVRRRLERRVELLEDDLWHARRSLESCKPACSSEMPLLLEMAGSLLKRAAAELPLGRKRL